MCRNMCHPPHAQVMWCFFIKFSCASCPVHPHYPVGGSSSVHPDSPASYGRLVVAAAITYSQNSEVRNHSMKDCLHLETCFRSHYYCCCCCCYDCVYYLPLSCSYHLKNFLCPPLNRLPVAEGTAHSHHPSYRSSSHPCSIQREKQFAYMLS
jgi:hypothetical protein